MALMKYHALFVSFEKSSTILNCRLLQIIGGSHEISCLICYFSKSSTIFNCRLQQIIDGALWVKTEQMFTVSVSNQNICFISDPASF